MLSPSTIRQLDELLRAQSEYRPNESIAGQLADRCMLMFVSPTCCGKNTIMETVAGMDDRFHVVVSFTSREPRTGDTNRTYYNNTDEGLRPLFQDIEARRVVQYDVNPFAHTIYGSRIEGYSGTHTMVDAFSSAVDQFRHLGFRQTLAYTIAADPVVWLRRFEERYPPGHPQRKARRDEAIESLNWSLAETSSDHFWVENIDGEPEVAARKVIAIATENARGEDGARSLAEECLQAAQGIAV